MWSTSQLYVIRLLQGTLGGEHPNFVAEAEFPAPIAVASGQVAGQLALLSETSSILTLCEVGRAEDARERFHALIRVALEELPPDWASLAIPVMVSVSCAHLGEVRHAERLHAILEPHAGGFVDMGPAWFGATSHHLALLAATLGRHDEAEARFAKAVAAYDALGAEAWLARARVDRARCLAERPCGHGSLTSTRPTDARGPCR